MTSLPGQGRSPLHLPPARVPFLGLTAAALAALLAGCGGGTTKTSTTASLPPPSPTRSATPSPATATPSGAAPTPSVPATVAASPVLDRCHTSQLGAAVVPRGVAAGTLLGYVTLTNTSSVTCTLYGFIGMGLLDAGKHVVPSIVIRGGGMGQEKALPKTTVTLAPGQMAHTQYSYSDVPSGTATSCPQASYVEVTPPDERDFLLVTTGFGPCRGQIGIGPVVAGAAPTS